MEEKNEFDEVLKHILKQEEGLEARGLEDWT